MKKFAIEEVVTNIATSYCHWIAEFALSHEIDKLLFLSRDGRIPFLVYNKLVELKILPDIPRTYLHVSRDSLSELVQGKAKSSGYGGSSLDYLKKHIPNGLSIGVIDAGWNGTAVRQLGKLFPENVFFGLYLGKHNSDNPFLEAYLGKIGIFRYFGFTELVETLFSSPEPSVKQVFLLNDSEEIDFYDQPEANQKFQELLHRKIDVKLAALTPQSLLNPSRKKIIRSLKRRVILPGSELLKKFDGLSHSHAGDEKSGILLIDSRIDSQTHRIYLPTWTALAIIKSRIPFKVKIYKSYLVARLVIQQIIKKILSEIRIGQR